MTISVLPPLTFDYWLLVMFLIEELKPVLL